MNWTVQTSPADVSKRKMADEKFLVLPDIF